MQPTCAHESCPCPPSPRYGAYCGSYCANVDRHESWDTDAGACSCDHAVCHAVRAAPHGNEGRTAIGCASQGDPDPTR